MPRRCRLHAERTGRTRRRAHAARQIEAPWEMLLLDLNRGRAGAPMSISSFMLDGSSIRAIFTRCSGSLVILTVAFCSFLLEQHVVARIRREPRSVCAIELHVANGAIDRPGRSRQSWSASPHHCMVHPPAVSSINDESAVIFFLSAAACFHDRFGRWGFCLWVPVPTDTR